MDIKLVLSPYFGEQLLLTEVSWGGYNEGRMEKITKILVVFLFLQRITYSFEIEDHYYRKVHPTDKGTVYIFLYNDSSSPEKIKEVKYNGYSVSDIPNDYCLWYQLTPPEIPPKSYGELKIKLRWRTKKVRFEK